MNRVVFSLLIFVILFNLQQTNGRLLETTTYVTTQNRGLTVKNHCQKTQRNTLYADFGIDGDIPYASSVSNFFNFNTSVVDYALDKNWNKVGDAVKQNGGKIFVFVGAWVIAFILMVILFPFLLCCCICPWSCPLWNRKKDNMPYSECQIKCPAVISLILLLIILICSIIAIVSSFKSNKSYDNITCSSGIILDDLLNGNVSYYNSNSFFTGVRTLDTQLKDLNSNIADLNTQIAKLGSAAPGVTTAKTQISTSKSSTAKIPDPSEAALTLEYDTPLQSSSPSSTIQSIFPALLGTKSNPISTVGAAYTSLTIYETLIDVIISAADTYNSNSASYVASINSAINETTRITNELDQQDKQLNNFFNDNEKNVKGSVIGEYVIYGLLIGFSVICIIAVLCTAWGKKEGCRKFMYFLCVFLFLLCLLTLFLCVAVSILNPVTYYSCQYFTQNLKNKIKLQNTLVSRFNFNRDDVEKISECLVENGSGDIASTLITEEVFDSLTALQSTFNNLTAITANYGQGITNLFTTLGTTITSYADARTNDITNTDAINQLKKLSKPSEYSCSSSGFSLDSWVPSIKQSPSYVPCQVNTGNSTLTTCPNNADFVGRAAGCQGCMDTYDLFKGNTTVTDVRNELDTRYSDPSCSTFNTQLSNVWNNFYKKKLDVIQPVLTRYNQAKSDSEFVVDGISYFTSIQQTINGNFSSIVNTKYGLIQGLNCKTIGEDIRLFRDVFCESTFVYTYFLRIILGIISLALSFLICCLTCVGHRQCKQAEYDTQTKYKDYKDDQGRKNAPSQQYFVELQKNNGQFPYNNNNLGYNYYNNGQGIY